MPDSALTKLVKDSFKEIKKRPFDRFVLGPFLIWYGLKSEKMGKFSRTIIISSGLYQTLFSLDDYKAVLKPVGSGDISKTYEVITNDRT